jgi:hypothetical protein
MPFLLSLPAPAARAEARRMVHCLIRELRAPAWQKGSNSDAAMRDEIRAWRRQHTATFRWGDR